MRWLLLLLSAVFTHAQENSFDEVARYLNPNGDFYLYLNSDQVGEKLMEFTKSLEEMVQGIDGDGAKAIEGMREMWRESGLLQLKGIGMSSVLWKEGVYANRSVAFHGDNPVTGKLWKLGAGEPHGFDGLSLMPANTVAGFTGTFRIDELFTFMTTLIPQMDPNAERGLDGVRQQWKEQGDDLDATMAAFTGEITVIVTMNPAKLRQISPEISIPEIGVLLSLGVRDDQFYRALAREIEKAPKAEPLDLPAVEGFSVHDPDRGPLRFQATLAKSATRIFLATNPELLADALATENRLADSDEFARLHDGLPARGNQLLFVSKTLTSQIKRIVRGELEKQVGPAGDAKKWAEHKGELPKLQIHGVPLDAKKLLDGALAKPAEARPGSKLLAYLDALGDYQGCIVTVHEDDAAVAYSNESVSLPARGMVSMGAIASAMILPRIAMSNRQTQLAHGQNNSTEALRQKGLGKLRRLGGAIRAISGEDRENRELPATLAVISDSKELPATAEIWDCPGTPKKTFHVSESDYVYLGAKLIDWAADADTRVIVHSPAGAYEGKWVNFLFLDGHVESRSGADPKAIVEEAGWIYGVREGELDAVKPPEAYDFLLEDGKLVLLDAADAREVGRAHPSEAFDIPDLELTAIAPWESLCWVGSSSGLFRYDAKALSWSRFAIERTHVDVPVDTLTLDGDLLQVGFAEKSTTFNLKTRSWQTAVVPPPEAVPETVELARETKPSFLVIVLVLLVLGVTIFAFRRRSGGAE
ncbi:MAG: prepilin-type processing-associated H-X9-DG protein [Rhodothermales bacterium]|jgi:prepilin-type processing-associated H-X9-DG protein